MANMTHAASDALINIYADLQHPPVPILQMIGHWLSVARMLDAVKPSRDAESAWARILSRVVYVLLTRLSGVRVAISSYFKLLDRMQAAAVLRLQPERQRFLCGLTEWVGLQHMTISPAHRWCIRKEVPR